MADDDRRSLLQRYPHAAGYVWLVLAVSGAFSVAGMLRQGSFRWGRGADASLLTRAESPGTFWTVVLFVAAMAAAGAYFGVQELRRQRTARQKELDPRTAPRSGSSREKP